MLKPIVIVGGGLAGLTLGIGLRQRGIPAVVWEAGHYPRHRVCGEFISGRGLRVLDRLQLHDQLCKSGAFVARSAAFYTDQHTDRGNQPMLQLPEPALCISRYRLDALLADQFRQSGGVLREDERWSQQEGEGVVWAAGRKIQNQTWRWCGIKAHAHDVNLNADLEAHLSRDGYVGLCRLAEGEFNVCALLRTHRSLPDLANTWPDRLRGAEGTALRKAMQNAEFIPGTFCSIAGLNLRPKSAAHRPGLPIGDALTMIAPITGNGMSMAFEAADSAVEPLVAFSHGKLDWESARRRVARKCDRAFRTRLYAAWALHSLLFRPALSTRLVATISRFPSLWRAVFYLTR